MFERSPLRVVAICLILGLLASPVVAQAAPAGAMPCCAAARGAEPCEAAGASVESLPNESAERAAPCPSMLPMACCEAQPAAPITPASSPPHANLLQAVAMLASPAYTGSDSLHPAARASAGTVARSSPQQLSVVLRV